MSWPDREVCPRCAGIGTVPFPASPSKPEPRTCDVPECDKPATDRGFAVLCTDHLNEFRDWQRQKEHA